MHLFRMFRGALNDEEPITKNEERTMKNTEQKTYRTKHFNVVSNAQNGVCLLFDRKGLGLYQSRTHRHYSLVMKDSCIEAVNGICQLFRTHLKNLMPGEKQPLALRPR
jgi:hypothetical protein